MYSTMMRWKGESVRVTILYIYSLLTSSQMVSSCLSRRSAYGFMTSSESPGDDKQRTRIRDVRYLSKIYVTLYRFP